VQMLWLCLNESESDLQGSNDQEFCRFVQVDDLKAFTLPSMMGITAVSLPGPVKQVKRSIAKTVRAYRGNFRRLTDLVRTTIVFSSFADIQCFIEALREKSICSPDDILPTEEVVALDEPHVDRKKAMMQILRVRNRFNPDPSYTKLLFGGYRDISLKIKMAFVCLGSNSASDCVKFVPLSKWRDPDAKRLVFEIQLHHKAMQLGSDLSEKEKHHRNYVKSRDVISA
jgi:hypothetical protein